MELLSRRSLIKAGALGTVALGTAGFAGSALADSTEAVQTWDGIRPHHVMAEVKNMDSAIHLWCDVMGLDLKSRIVIAKTAESQVGVLSEGVDDAMGMADDQEAEIVSMREIVRLQNDTGVVVELTHNVIPDEIETPRENRTYGAAGYLEFAFLVDDIDAWYDRIVEAGYTPLSDAPWPAGPTQLSFQFYDDEGNVIQLMAYIEGEEVPAVNEWPGEGMGDQRTPEQIELCEASYVS